MGDVGDAWERDGVLTSLEAYGKDGMEPGAGESHAWYVKDWHCFAQLESEGGTAEDLYTVPDCFMGKSTLLSLSSSYGSL